MRHTLNGVPARWKLKELLDREGLNVNKLSLAMADEKRAAAKRPQLYAITGKEAEGIKRIDVGYVDEIMRALHSLTGKTFVWEDLFEYEAPPE